MRSCASTSSSISDVPETSTEVQIFGVRYDGSPHWQHPARLLEAMDGVVITETRAGLQVLHDGTPWTSPYNTRGHYWPDRYFNVIRLELPDTRKLHGWYCNIATPVQFDGQTVRYVDLDLDVIVHHGAANDWEIRDRDEFEQARERYAYPESVVRDALAAIDDLVAMVEAREFPFDE